jgi:hypothetical protein
MLRRFPGTLRWRQALPPLFLGSLLLLGITSIFIPSVLYLLTFEVVLYLAILAVFGAIIARKVHRIGCIIGFPAAIATMHVCWGAGFLWSLIK